MSPTQPRLGYDGFGKTAPAARAALVALGKAVEESGLDKGLVELVKLRASHMNGCAFCLAFHLALARKAGVPQDKLDLMTVWRDAPVFSPRERAALAWTEALTDVGRGGGTDDAHAGVLDQFSEAEAAFLTVAVATINAWNRIAVGLGFVPVAAAPATASAA
jgi:AhpD family alkylhydroperoxidase